MPATMKRPRRAAAPGRRRAKTTWTFLSNHAHVLICIAADPSAHITEIAAQVGITYRGVQRILRELEDEGYVSHTRAPDDARSNVYRVERSLPLRHPLVRHQRISALLDLAGPKGGR